MNPGKTVQSIVRRLVGNTYARRIFKDFILTGTIASTLQLVVYVCVLGPRADIYDSLCRSVEEDAQSCRACTGHWPRNLDEMENYTGPYVGDAQPCAALKEADGIVDEAQRRGLQVEFTPLPDGSCQVQYTGTYQGGFQLVRIIKNPSSRK